MGNIFQFIVFTFLENALIYAFLLMLQFPSQNSRQNVLKICFSQDETGGENYDLLYQKSIKKYVEYLER